MKLRLGTQGRRRYNCGGGRLLEFILSARLKQIVEITSLTPSIPLTRSPDYFPPPPSSSTSTPLQSNWKPSEYKLNQTVWERSNIFVVIKKYKI